MSLQLSNTDYTLTLLERLLTIRGIDLDQREAFLDPQLSDHWLDPNLLDQMDIGTDRIIRAIKDKESICVF